MNANDSGLVDDGTPEKIGLDVKPKNSVFDEKRHITDDAWGQIAIPELCMRIVDTPQFQRMRDLKQLGPLSFVYPGATQTRFAHSLGACKLAGDLLELLKKPLLKDYEIEITDKDVLCTQIAALCHDLGHGPLSHTFDGLFIPLATGKKWQHEQGSVDMLKFLLQENPEVKEDLVKHGQLEEIDFQFIYEMIVGPDSREKVNYEASDLRDKWPYKGRPFEKSFLYEIVANKYNGIDVDKFDYFKRDALHLHLTISFSCEPSLQQPRVREIPNVYRTICYRDKSRDNLKDLFTTRMSLHSRAYQHRVNKILEAMFCEVMCIANDYLWYTGKDGKKYRLSDSIQDMEAFMLVTDNIFYEIERRKEEKGLEKARGILNDIKHRKLFAAGMAVTEETIGNFERGINQEIAEEIAQSVGLDASDFLVMVAHLDYGMGPENPLSNIWLYAKNETSEPLKRFKTAEKCKVETRIVVSYKKQGENAELAMKAFKCWCEKRQLEFVEPRIKYR